MTKPFFKIIIFVSYIIITMIIGEVHPFSNFPMYNSFPNWSYAFYITDSKGKVLPFKAYTNTTSGKINHQYSSSFQTLGINYGYGEEAAEHLTAVGSKLMEQISFIPNAEINDTVLLYRVHFYFEGNDIKRTDTLLGKKYVNGN